jgi:hypothetical protein
MLLLGELFDLGGLVGLVNATFSSISFDIGELVDAENVLLVERGKVELASSGGGLGGRGVLDKGESLIRDQFQALYCVFIPDITPTEETFHRRPWACVSSPRVSCRLC